MMKRKYDIDEDEKTDRWLVSYADFITLLFAFFVVMYSMSSINEGKYRVLSDTMIDAFKTPPKSTEPIQIGEQSKAIKTVDPVLPKPDIVKIKPEQVVDGRRMERLADSISHSMQPLIDKKLIKVSHDKLWVEVEMNTSILFSSGHAKLENAAYPLLEELSEVIKTLPNHVDVEGHTDNLPIKTKLYPSNWELSAARAESVVHLFTRNGVSPERLRAVHRR